ncbi:MAG: hypothetical protein JNN12_01950 [Bacteroidetes Order II. Incertae sedis bacterium]|nr:hypothetical protein [Bacteroidetes Order II. bacterium]
MAIIKELKTTIPYRIVPVRFERATTGNPSARRPDIDDRGYVATNPSGIHGPVVGVLKDEEVEIRLRRENISNDAPLFITTEDTAVIRIVRPTGQLSGSSTHIVRIRGLDGGNPQGARVKVRFGSAIGPIIHELGVWVWDPVTVNVTPHLVTITSTTNTTGVGSVIDFPAVMRMVNDIWKPAGIVFNFPNTLSAAHRMTVNLATAGTVATTADFNQIIQTRWVRNTINVYCVSRFNISGASGLEFLGFGFSTNAYASNGINRPSIFLADSSPSISRDLMYWANDLAHEIGHFLALWHPENVQAPNARADTWSRRNLMHNYNSMFGTSPATGQNYTARIDDVGYGMFNGSARRGCMLCLKDLAQLTEDDQARRARTQAGTPTTLYGNLTNLGTAPTTP